MIIAIRVFVVVLIIATTYFVFNQSLKSLIVGLLLALFFTLLEYLFEKVSRASALCSFIAVEIGFIIGFMSLYLGDFLFDFSSLIAKIEILLFLISALAFFIVKLIRKNLAKTGKTAKFISSQTLTADISAFEDGRFYNLLKSKFIEAKIVAPSFILDELKNKSQLNDNVKKYRARRALNIIDKLKGNDSLTIKDCKGQFSDEKDLSGKIISFALKENLKIITADFNFAKNAMLRKARILNLLELADYLAPIYAPGDSITVFLSKEGEQQNQALGFLSDGSMVVVEDGKRYIGKKVKLNIVSVMQSSLNRIFFAKTLFTDNQEWKNNRKNGDK